MYCCVDSDEETRDTEVNSLPTEVHDEFWIHVRRRRDPNQHDKTLGKWMVFKHYDEIDQTWKNIQTAILSDDMQGCVYAKCSTMMYSPSCSGPGPDTCGVICVYTSQNNMDDIGFRLIEIVKQDIKYKLDEATLDYKYVHAGSGKVTIKTIFWNNGMPSFVCEDTCYGTSYFREDIWHLNVVTAPEPQCVHGRWVLPLEYQELTELWHTLKKVIQSKKDNYGIIKMVCPPKRVHNSATEVPVFHIYTSDRNSKSVGIKLISIVEKDIHYERKPQSPDSEAGRAETLFWNEGEPDYEKISRKGITKNWRTGEDM